MKVTLPDVRSPDRRRCAGDAAGFAARHVGGADGIEQRGLAVVDVAMMVTTGGRTRVSGASTTNTPSSSARTRGAVWPSSSAQLGGIGVDHVGIFAIWPCFSNLITSTPRSAMRLASSQDDRLGTTTAAIFSLAAASRWPVSAARAGEQATGRSRTSSVEGAVTSVRGRAFWVGCRFWASARGPAPLPRRGAALRRRRPRA